MGDLYKEIEGFIRLMINAVAWGTILLVALAVVAFVLQFIFPPKCPHCGSTRLRQTNEPLRDAGLDVRCLDCGRLTI